MAFLLPFFTALLLLGLQDVTSESHTTSVVSDCAELQDALKRNHVTKVIVQGAIRCTRDDWQVPAIVRRSLEITGDPSEMNATQAHRGSVDWTDTSRVVIAEHASLSIHDLVIKQDDLGVGGINLAFIHTTEGSAAVLSGIVLMVERCSKPVWEYDELIDRIRRPDFLAGDQRTQALGSTVLLLQDVAIWWPFLQSVWQLCNSVIFCLDDYRGEIRVEDYYLSGLVVNNCARVVETTPDAISMLNASSPFLNNRVPEAKIEMEEEEPVERQSDTVSTIIIVAVVTGVILCITIAVSVKCIRCGGSRSDDPSYRSKKDQSSMGDTSPRGKHLRSAKHKTPCGHCHLVDGTSSRYLPNKNDMDLDFFERGTNVPLQDVVIGSLLGRGGFGKVYKGD